MNDVVTRPAAGAKRRLAPGVGSVSALAQGPTSQDDVRTIVISLDRRFASVLVEVLTSNGVVAGATSPDAWQPAIRDHTIVVFDTEGAQLDSLVQMKQQFENVRCLVLGWLNPEIIVEGFALGADGWLLRSEPLPTIASGVLTLARGGVVVSPAVFRCLLALAGIESRQSSSGRRPGGLSARQLEVLLLAARGLTDHEIAERLVLSVRTVNRHMSDILSALHCSSRAEAGRLVLCEMPTGERDDTALHRARS